MISLDEVKQAQDDMNELITRAISEFEKKTGTLVRSVTISHSNYGTYAQWEYELLPVKTEVVIK